MVGHRGDGRFPWRGLFYGGLALIVMVGTVNEASKMGGGD